MLPHPPIVRDLPPSNECTFSLFHSLSRSLPLNSPSFLPSLFSFRLLSHECVRSGVALFLGRIIDRNLLLRRLLRLRRFRSFVLNEALRRAAAEAEAAAATNARRLPAPLLIQVGTSGQVVGWVEINIRRSPQFWAVTVATFCPGNIPNHSQCNPTSTSADGPPCTVGC